MEQLRNIRDPCVIKMVYRRSGRVHMYVRLLFCIKHKCCVLFFFWNSCFLPLCSPAVARRRKGAIYVGTSRTGFLCAPCFSAQQRNTFVYLIHVWTNTFSYLFNFEMLSPIPTPPHIIFALYTNWNSSLVQFRMPFISWKTLLELTSLCFFIIHAHQPEIAS